MIPAKRKEYIMICNNCSSEITDSAKFCPVCGQKCAPAPLFCTNCGLELKPGSKFCPVCGIPVGEKEIKPESLDYVGNVDDPKSAFESLVAAMPSAPSISTDAPVIPEAPVLSEIPSGIPTPVNGSSTSGFGMPKPVNDIAGAVIAPTESAPIYAGASVAETDHRVNLAKPVPQPDYADFGDLGLAGAAALPVTPIKKCNGGKIAIIIGAAVFTIAAVLAVVFMLNKGPIMNMFMGDSRYASMIEGRGLKNVSQYADSPVISQGIKSVSASYVVSAAAVNSYDNYSSAKTMIRTNNTASQFAAMLEQYKSMMLKTYGVNSASVKLDTDITVTDTAKALLFSNYATEEEKAEFDKALEALNSVTFTYDITADNDSAMLGVEMTESGLTVNAQAFMLSDGTVYICFPFGSDKAIKYVMKDGVAVFAEEAPELKLDENEIARLIEEITDIYLRYYENSEIVIEGDGELFASDAKAHGTLITVTMNSGLLEDMFTEIGRHIADDTYFSGQIIDYVRECGMELTLDEYKEDIISAFDTDINDDYSLVIKSVVDKNNNILGKSYSLSGAYNFEINDTSSYDSYSSVNNVCFSYVESSDVFAAETGYFSTYSLADNIYTDEFNISALMKRTSETDGTVSLKIRSNEDSYAANIEYSGAKTEKFLGSDVNTGTYTVTITPPADFTEDISSVDAAVLAALSAAKFTVSSGIDDNAYLCTFKIDIPQYGSIALNMSMAGSDGKVSVPSGDVIEISDTLAQYLSSYNFMYGYGSYDGAELSDADKAAMEELSALFEELKDKAASSDSYFAQYISEALGESSQKFSTVPVPYAIDDDVSALNARIYKDITAVENIHDRPDLSELLKSKCSDLSSNLYGLFYEVYFGMSQDSYDSISAQLNKHEEALAALEKEAEELTIPAVPDIGFSDYDFSEMSYEVLLLASADITSRYGMAAYTMTNSGLETDPDMAKLNAEAEEACIAAANSLQRLGESISNGNLSVPLLRDARKKMKAYEEAVNAFVKAMLISQ